MSKAFAEASSFEGVRSSMNAARDGIDAVLRDRGLRRSTPEDTAASLLRGAAASATLAGDPVTAEQLTAGSGGPTARAALRLSSELLSLVPVLRQSPVQAMARIHALAAAGSIDDSELGQPKNSDGRDRIVALARALSEDSSTPALLVAAYAHAEVASAGAFGSHDDVVARALERLILVERGVDPASVLVPEAGHAAAAGAYRAALESFTPRDPQLWLLYASEAYLRAAEASPLAHSGERQG